MLKNKMLKKILCFSFILMLIFSVYKIGKVWASSDVFEITDASISEKSDTVEASIDSFENNTIKSSVAYHKVNDYVVYKITIKNQGSEDYTIKEIFDDNEDEYLEWKYDKHQNDTFKAGTSKEILLKIIYKKEVSDINKREDTNRGKLSFKFLDEDGKEIDGDININPNTGDNILFYVGMGIIALSGLVLVLVGKKQKKVKKLALFMILSIPFVVKALSPSLIIEFTNRAKLYDKLVVKVGDEYKVVPYEEKVTKPADPEKEGYTFAGWYVGNTEYDFNSEVTEDIQIEAKFTANTYEVIFDKNSAEATGTMSNVTLTYDEASNLPDNGYSAQGYIFGGWNTKADGTGDSYLNKEEVVNLATTGTVTLYAKWVSDTNMPYKVKHMKQKVTLDGYELAETDNETGTTGEEVTPAVKTYSGFKSPETKTVKIKGDGSTEIVYEYDREEYAYTFDSENVTSSKDAGNYAYETSITVTAKEKEGYTFSKWSNDETANPYTFTISGITNLTPEYTENTYEVVFDKNSETAEGTMTNESFNYTEEKALTKNAYTNEGYVFAGWNTKADGSGDSYLDEVEVTKLIGSGTITLYAQWMSMNATIAGGSTFRSKISSLANGFRNVKSFQRSYTKPDISTMTNNNIISTSDSLAPVYAWSENGNIYYWTEAPNPLLSSGQEMFYNLRNIKKIDLSTIDTSNVTYMHEMFYNCSSLTSLDLGDNFNTSNVINMQEMFSNCSSLTSLDLGDNFDTSNVTSMSYMFYNCSSLTTLDLGDNFDTSNVTNMINMFYNCSSLTTLDLGDNFDTSNVTNMQEMFNNCSSLTSLDLGDNFDTSNVKNMNSMFNNCSSLASLDLGDNFDTSNVTDMISMFAYCNNLTTLDLGDKFDTSKVTYMQYMFNDCSSLTELDISMFDVSKVTNMEAMFRSCSNLTTIYASTDFEVDVDEVNTYDMFGGDTKLVGGKGTKYSSSYTNGERAHVDEGTSDPGYFTHGLPTKTITFNPAGGTVNVESKSVSTGKKAMSLPVASKEGYDFIGWYTDVINGELFDEDSVVNNDITVYAHWIKGDTIIHKDNNNDYNINEGDELLIGAEEFYVISGGNTITLLPKYNLDENYRQSKKNYVNTSFSDSSYWNTTKYYTREVYTSSSSYYEHDEYYGVSDDYSYIGNGYYIYRDKNDNDTSNNLYDYVNNYKDHLINDKGMTGVTDARLMYYGEMDVYCYPGSSYTKCPYLTQSFWLGTTNDSSNPDYYPDEDIYYVYYNGGYSNIVNDDYYNSRGIRPVIAVEESSLLSDVTVTFETNGGTEVADQTIKYGKTISWPTNPVKENRKFMGWYTDPEFTNRFKQNTKVTKDTTLYAKFVDWCKTFSTDSWETISSNIEQDPSYYGYGCEKDVSIDMDDNGTPETYKVRIANTSRPAVCDTEGYSQTACGVVIEFVNTVADKRISATATQWSETELASWLNTEFYNKIPSDLKNLIIPTYPIKTNLYSPFDIINKDNSNNMIYLLSHGDVTGDGNEGRKLDYYNDEFGDYTLIKKDINNIDKAWWLRSARNGDTNIGRRYFYNWGSLYNNNNNYTQTYGIAPAFRIGTPVYNVTFETNGGTKITKQSIKSGGTATRPASNPTKRNNEFVNWYTDETFETEFDFENTAITDDTVVYAKYVNLCEAFENDNWDTIVSNINTDSNYYPIACEKEVLIDMDDDETPESYTVRLANRSTPEVCSTEGYSQTSCGTVIEFVDVVGTRGMNSTNTNAGGWKETEMVTYLNSDFYNKLPSSLQSVIIPTYPIVSGSGYNQTSENITNEDTTKNKIYLLSKREIGNETYLDNKSNVTTDTRTLDYYVTYNSDNDRIKKNLSGNRVQWWLRSATSDYSSYYHYVYNDGYYSFYYDSASGVKGVAPAFRIGINN